jgi:hypothetical protein
LDARTTPNAEIAFNTGGWRSRAPPLALTTVWLANTASLLLPVSNLTITQPQE